MNPQRREKQAKPVEDTPDEPQASTLARMGLQAITDAEMDDVCDVLTDSLASLADLRAAGPPAVKELRRLRAEVAAKDAEIARLRREIEPTDEEEERAARMQPHYFDEPYKPKRKKRTGKATP